MLSLPAKIQASIIMALNSLYRYLDDLLNIGNIYTFEKMVDKTFPNEVQLNKSKTF